MRLYEILIPGINNEGKEIPESYHHGWDEWVTKKIGGLTILNHNYKGKWQNSVERIIPVRVACEEPQLQEILKFSLTYYDQEAMMAYEISDNVIIQKKSWQ
jgi:hypothetical protein